ncbi:hypothetical protein PVAND_004187 [Polypedilum vanderplanki]|uniref:Ketosynthase family 3 (KS3) domain-containing protein n=1 Tax=Polypedilum vanderplanki TaxID=319348 RepID=A0A9J6BWC8_POLVA|nr:hypothetical protein PVAND_004187 [Polypedilum vanderplanki]
MANRVSYALGLCGPSFTVDTACSSSAYALDCAFHYIQSGVCDAALVGGTQLNLNCGVTQEYSKLGILANDGVCRPFDENATGFARADTIYERTYLPHPRFPVSLAGLGVPSPVVASVESMSQAC